jgi:hypothetical protein
VGKVLLVLGGVGLLVAGAVVVVSLVLPLVSSGRTSWEEALWGIIPGLSCSGLSVVVAAVGLVLALTGKPSSSAERRRGRRR